MLVISEDYNFPGVAGSFLTTLPPGKPIYVCVCACVCGCVQSILGFPGGSVVKNLPAVQEMQETRVSSLGQEDPLEEGMATHSSILAWRIRWTEAPGGLHSMGSQRVGHH